MEAAEDPAFLEAMQRVRIKGVCVGVESVTQDGLKDVYKDFNVAGDELVARLREFGRHGVHLLGSFIFGLPSDRPETFEATAMVAQRAGVAFAQFIMLTPFPGTIDFQRWEEKMTEQMTYVDGVPLTRYWLISAAKRPKVYTQHPTMTAEEIRHGTQETWDRFYTLRAIWQRASWLKTLGERLGFVLISKLYRQMYAAPVSRPTARGCRGRRCGHAGSPNRRSVCLPPRRCPSCKYRPHARRHG